MNNLSTPASYEQAPTATSLQSGGRGYSHRRGCKCKRCNKCKKGCRCPLCKKRGGTNGDEVEEDIETGSMSKDDKMKDDFEFAKDNEYDDELLSAAEEGRGGPGVKVGGTRRRRRKHSKKSRKGGKSRKTRRHSRKGRKH
jgi:hypothetical protein